MTKLARLFHKADDVVDAWRDALRHRNVKGALDILLDDDSITCVLPEGHRLSGHVEIDEQGNIYILGSTIETICTDFDHQQFETAERSTVALLHDHDLDLFSELAKPREKACSFGGSWNWHGERLPLDSIHSEELSKKFGFIQHPQPI